jgi:hypothetical protein
MEDAMRIERALRELNDLIDNGAEFPDVVDRVARSWRIKVDTLTAAYDGQFA